MTKRMTKAQRVKPHYVTIEHVHAIARSGFRASCTCGWWSDCYAQASDATQAMTVHRRRAESVETHTHERGRRRG